MELDVKAVSGINTPLYLRVTDLRPNERVRVSVSTVDSHRQPWSTDQAFRANELGVVDLATTLPESAQWEPAHSLGILWSMRPDSAGLGEDDVSAFDLNGLSPIHLNVRVRIKGEGLGSLLQRTIARNAYQFEGPCGPAFYTKRGPGVVLLIDAPASTNSASAAALAHHGFATMYATSTPSVAELERFHRSEFVDPTVPLALVAHGRACTKAFELAAAHPELIGPVVAHSPSDVAYPDPPRQEFRRTKLTGKPADLAGFHAAHRAQATPIDVAGMTGPLLVTVGAEDAVWDGVGMAGALAEKAEGVGVETFLAAYSGAGHMCGYPFAFPGLPTATVMRDHGHRIRVGGSIDANGRAAQISRQQVISFLASSYDMPVTTI